MSFRSRGSSEWQPFRGDSRGKFYNGGRTRRPFNEEGSYVDSRSGGRYNSFRGSRESWFDEERGVRSSRHSPGSTRSHDRYSDSHHYSPNRSIDDPLRRKYKKDYSRYKQDYNDPANERGGDGHSFKSESGFKRRPSRDIGSFDNSEYREFQQSTSYSRRILRSGSRGASRVSAASRRPYIGRTFFRGRDSRSSSRHMGARFSTTSFGRLKTARMLKMKNDVSSDDDDDDDYYNKMSDFDYLGYSEEGEEEDSERKRNEDPVLDENSEGTIKKRSAATDSLKKSVKKKIRAKDDSANEEETAKRESKTNDINKKLIHLECPHCKRSYKTFAYYNYHLHGPEHKAALMNAVEKSNRKLRKLRIEQRRKQKELDQQNDRTRLFYCQICQLNYKQTKIEHHSSDYHKQITRLSHRRCNVCRLKFLKPITYEYHLANLAHIKREAFVKRQTEALERNVEESDEQFITLDSVGSGDDEPGQDDYNDNGNAAETNECNEGTKVYETKQENKSGERNEEAGETNEENKSDEWNEEANETNEENKSDKRKAMLDEIKEKCMELVKVYYCKLCSTCLPYKPGYTPGYVLKMHCKERFHIRRLMRRKSQQTLAKKELAKKLEKRIPKKQNDDIEDKSEETVLQAVKLKETVSQVGKSEETMAQAEKSEKPQIDDEDHADTFVIEDDDNDDMEKEKKENVDNRDNNETSDDDCYENTEARFDKFSKI